MALTQNPNAHSIANFLHAPGLDDETRSRIECLALIFPGVQYTYYASASPGELEESMHVFILNMHRCSDPDFCTAVSKCFNGLFLSSGVLRTILEKGKL